MRYDDKRTQDMSTALVQAGNKQWWTAITMSYDDWGKQSPYEKFTPAWFDDIDKRFLHSDRLFSDQPNPFEALMAGVKGKRVLEIGCGMGFHAELLTRAGADLTTVDLSPTSVMATKKRLELKGLKADVREMDAESLALPDGHFDIVWSWGVILASARTGRIVREIDRVLKPGGEARIMVYNLEGMPAYKEMLTRYMIGFWFGKSLDEILWKSTDGFSARFYTKDMVADLLATFFEQIAVTPFGEEANAVPLPRFLRRPLLKLISPSRQRALARKHASYLYAVARKA
ncbi:MAG: hypothetical protein RL274_501 [Pseudomonadota bacterium]|jgi:2-polyprenyl-3-methyl-5-hydroxy-6-metoxy-1,4-benzoquinol methylase